MRGNAPYPAFFVFPNPGKRLNVANDTKRQVRRINHEVRSWPEVSMTERRPYSRHGLNALKARVKVRGLAAIDTRTVAARELLDWRQELLADLGGEDAVSAQQKALVDMAVRTRLYINHADAFLLEQHSLVNGKRRSLIPLVKERQALVDSLVRILGQLGLERKARPAKTLTQVLEEMAVEKAESEPRESTQPPADETTTEAV